MDRELPARVIRQKRLRFFATTLLILAILATGFWAFRSFIQPSVPLADIHTAVVEKGDIENTITASGEVLPEFEEVMTSPVNASIKEILRQAGSRVDAGQSILTLDKSAARTEYEKEKFQWETRRNEINKLKLDLGKSFYDLQSNNDIKQLHIGNLTDAVENADRLYKAGGGTKESVEQAQLNLKVAQLEKKQLENEIHNKQATMQLEIKEAEIACDIEKNNLDELARKLQLADIRASRSGVVTWVNQNIGVSVHEGESLARIANLDAFKVQGTVSDNYLSSLRLGMPVIVRINDSLLRGKVVNIHPAIENSIATFDVQLSDPHDPQLHPNMKADVYLVTQIHSQVLRVANGPALKGVSPVPLFLIHGQKAQRVEVHTGLSNFDYIEILDILQPGDRIITSDMSEYKNSPQITLK